MVPFQIQQPPPLSDSTFVQNLFRGSPGFFPRCPIWRFYPQAVGKVAVRVWIKARFVHSLCVTCPLMAKMTAPNVSIDPVSVVVIGLSASLFIATAKLAALRYHGHPLSQAVLILL